MLQLMITRLRLIWNELFRKPARGLDDDNPFLIL